MSKNRVHLSLILFHNWILKHIQRGKIPAGALTVILAGVIGVLGGYGAVFFTYLIDAVSGLSVEPFLKLSGDHQAWLGALCIVPAVGLLLVSWFTRRFAPEAQGHGVPEVITAIARHDGVIRPRVSLVKILASGFCIGTGGSIGREGPIIQIGSSLGSMSGQLFNLSARRIKVLVAAGAAAGISATFNAPLAGVIFSSEIILGSFAIESLTPIVIASVLADVVQHQVGEHGTHSAFVQLNYEFQGAWEQLPTYLVLGLACGLAAVGFTKLLYFIEDVGKRYVPKWWVRSLIFGTIVGVVGVVYPNVPPTLSPAAQDKLENNVSQLPPLFGVGYGVVDHALHLENKAKPKSRKSEEAGTILDKNEVKSVRLNQSDMLAELWWLLPLALLKPLMTSLTLGGGGSGGIFAPSLFLGGTLGASFGILCNLFIPEWSADPGVYAIVGMGAVVAGTTHGMLSAILIVYEMTNDYRIILPIMAAAGLSSLIARYIDPESIYLKKLSRRGESIARGLDLECMEHIMVRDVMIRDFPAVKPTDNLTEIIRVAEENSHFESLPVIDNENRLLGIIRPEDLHNMLDSDMPPQLLNAGDMAFSRWLPGWQAWVHYGGEFYAISDPVDVERDPPIDHIRVEINDAGEIAWWWLPNGGFTPSGIRYMRRIRDGDVDFDGEVEA
ncbi:MAG: chloride channel protein, partial [Planctomycetes bacterium]|nr:chloride channel protein [Planctomycetota bacterium]